MQSTCHWKQLVWPPWCLSAEPASPPQLPTAPDLLTVVVIFPVPLSVISPCVLNFEFKFTVKDLARGGGSLINQQFYANQTTEKIYRKGHPDFFLKDWYQFGLNFGQNHREEKGRYNLEKKHFLIQINRKVWPQYDYTQCKHSVTHKYSFLLPS